MSARGYELQLVSLSNIKNKLAPCGMPSFPEGNVIHEFLFTGFKWTLQKLWSHNKQVMPNLKLSLRDLTLHSESVVAVVSEVQG